MTRSLYLNITYRCNSRCKFCAADVAYLRDAPEVDLKAILQMIGERHYDTIALSGGEPTIHPEFLSIASICRSHAGRVVLYTHGRGLKDLGFTRSLLEAGVGKFIIPLYGHTGPDHDRVTQVKGSFDQTVEGLKNLALLKGQFPIFVELKLLLTRYTAPLNPMIYRFAASNLRSAVDQLSICPLIYSDSTLAFREEYSAPFEAMKQDLYGLVEEITRDGLWGVRLNEFPPCFFESEALRRVAHPHLGQVPTEDLLRREYGDMNLSQTVSIRDGVDFDTTREGTCLIQSCQKCIYRSYCDRNLTPYFSMRYLGEFGETSFHPFSHGDHPKTA